MSQKDKISHIRVSCVLASTKYVAREHRTATACSNIDILGFTTSQGRSGLPYKFDADLW